MSDRQKMSNVAQNIDASSWYYENRSHLLIVREVWDSSGAYIQTEQFKLPWRMIEASRRRRPKTKSRSKGGGMR